MLYTIICSSPKFIECITCYPPYESNTPSGTIIRVNQHYNEVFGWYTWSLLSRGKCFFGGGRTLLSISRKKYKFEFSLWKIRLCPSLWNEVCQWDVHVESLVFCYTNKTDSYCIHEILLKMTLNINYSPMLFCQYKWLICTVQI